MKSSIQLKSFKATNKNMLSKYICTTIYCFVFAKLFITCWHGYRLVFFFPAGLGETCVNPNRNCYVTNSYCDTSSTLTCQCATGYVASGTSCISGTGEFESPSTSSVTLLLYYCIILRCVHVTEVLSTVGTRGLSKYCPKLLHWLIQVDD